MATPRPPSPPPPPPPSPDYYYFVVTLAVFAIMLVLSNIIAFACCSPWGAVRSFTRLFRRHGPVASGPPMELIIPVSKYREDQAYGTECSVCLTGFAEGEDVRQLPVRKHSFHAPCIDRWLCSHSSCPLCRGTVAGLPLPPQQRCPRAAAGPHRPRLFTESHSMGQVVVAIM